MTNDELIHRLADDLEVTRARAEDYLLSLIEIVTEELKQKRSVYIARFGHFETVKGAERPYRFRFAKEMYPILGIVSKINLDKCVECKDRQPLPGKRRCRPCDSALRAKRWPRKRKKLGGNHG